MIFLTFFLLVPSRTARKRPETRRHREPMRRGLQRILEAVSQVQQIIRLERLTDLETSSILTLGETPCVRAAVDG